jgi:glutamate-ammonia-ligase adenylyltransferase
VTLNSWFRGLQLIYAPAHGSNLLGGNTLSAIERLGTAGYLEDSDAASLVEDYTFLRRIEHHLQILEDRQVHSVPESEADVRALGHRMLGRATSPDAFLAALAACMDRVRIRYEQFMARFGAAE